MWKNAKKVNPPDKKVSKEYESMKVYKYITILLVVLLGVFCGRGWGESLAPDTYLYPMICLGLALIVWGSDYDEKSQDENRKNAAN